MKKLTYKERIENLERAIKWLSIAVFIALLI